MECISDSIARCHVVESADADASSYDVGSPASVKKIPGEYLFGGCDNHLDLRGMTRLVVVCQAGLAATQVSIRHFSKGVVRIGCYTRVR